MERFSENQIRRLHAEFREQKKYTAKLAFFDRLFGIIPFSFPEFDPALSFFFQSDQTDRLSIIFKNERNNPGITEKIFVFGEPFVFNIKPANSNSPAYNHFILNSFLSKAPRFDQWITEQVTTAKAIDRFLDEANAIVNRIECCLQNDHDKSFTLQCMSIFYKGFYDGFSRHVNLPGKKRKFTELYLYAQGIIYSTYIHSLKAALRKSRFPQETEAPVPLDLAGKMDLLQELGVIDFLQNKINGSDLKGNSLAEILCQITGEEIIRKTEIIRKLEKIKQ